MTSSGLGDIACPGMLTYSASKAFVTRLVEGLNFELAPKIDCLSYHCGMVRTKLLTDSM